MKTKVQVTTRRRGHTFYAIADVVSKDGETGVLKYGTNEKHVAKRALVEAMDRLFGPDSTAKKKRRGTLRRAV